MPKFILIDGSGLIYRGFYAVPPFFRSPDGKLTNAVFGFTSIILSLMAAHKPDYMAVAFDMKGPTFRHKEFKEYKATRVKAPQELYDQIPLVKNVVSAFGMPGFEREGYEADDIIATIVKNLSGKKELDILVATGDFDMFQVVRPGVSILYPVKGFKGAEKFGEHEIIEKYGLTPSQIPDYKGLAGDSSDNIPGVYGIGEKGAKNLIAKYGSVENIYKHLGEITGATHAKLAAGHESALQSKSLATLRYDVPIDFDLEHCRVKHFDLRKVKEVFGELGFKNLQKRIDGLFDKRVAAETVAAQKSLF